ncbi:MAG: hypothetical protein MJ247_04715 [Alphaproteobacteria bacterium]|nr:hypothetical protein [Alphaproteobacteria bacterium]
MEIERKFIPSKSFLEELTTEGRYQCHLYYLSKTGDYEIRLRDDKFKNWWMTIKSKSQDVKSRGLCRSEIEIPVNENTDMVINDFKQNSLGELVYYKQNIFEQGKRFEFRFVPQLDITYFEIEFQSLEECEKFVINPHLIEKEVTNDPNFSMKAIYNKILAKKK